MEATTPAPHVLADLARASLSGASVATVTPRHETAGPAGAGAAQVVVKVSCDRYGRPILHLAPESPLVGRIEQEPVVTVTVAAQEPFEALALHGPAIRVRHCSNERKVVYRVALLGVNFLRPQQTPVGLAAFHAAAPDELWGQGDIMLDHLQRHHAAALDSCVRSHGMPEAESVVARSLDRRGIDLAVLTAQGVTAVWMPFLEGPVTSPAELAWQIRLCLTCRCREHQRDRHEGEQ